MTLRVVAPGALTTVQDLGRPGHGAIGVPPSGAMDPFALRAANRLVGNPDGAAGLELTLAGPVLTMGSDHVVAITGAPFECDLDGEPVPRAAAVRVRSGQTLRVGRAAAGLRGYLAVRGGIVVPEILGSRSTYLAGGVGGMEGRAVAAGDVLPVGRADAGPPLRQLPPGMNPIARPPFRLGVVMGPQDHAFTERGRARFLEETWRVSPRSDRIGVRLEGRPVEPAGPAGIDPEGVVTGAVQIPGDGLPIVLGPDRPATGGYAKIATVIAADAVKLAQARPGDEVRFTQVTLERGRVSWRRLEQALDDGTGEPA
jgi:biotin-dependent carboxylase-like uncharacterized protein